jgi:hypothetical protein
MTALRTAPTIALARRPSPPRFEIGDRVLLDPNGAEGVIIGVRYGAPAYDVRVNGTCLRNLPPEQLRLADSQLSAPVVPLRRVGSDCPEFLL